MSSGSYPRISTTPPSTAGPTLSAWGVPPMSASPIIANSTSRSPEKGRPNSSFTPQTAAADEAALDPIPLPGAIFSRIVTSTRTGFPYAPSSAITAGVITLSSFLAGSSFPLRLRITSSPAPSSMPTSNRSPTPSSVSPITSKPQPRFATVPGAKTLIYRMIKISF